MIDNIARLFLNFSHDNVIIPIIILGYIWLDREVFFHAACVLFLSMISDYCLKFTFKVPLSFDSGTENYAFPSGHMQSSFVFYGWLFLFARNYIVKALIVIILIGVGFGLINCGYHNNRDILGAIFFGTIILVFYKFYFQKDKNKLLLITVSSASILMLYFHIIHNVNHGICLPYYALLGFVSGNYYIKNKEIQTNNLNKICATLFSISVLFIVNKLYSYINLPLYLGHTKWFIICFFIVTSMHYAVLIRSKLTANVR